MVGGLGPLGELGCSALLYLLLLRRLRRRSPPPWWLGYARDAVNVVTLALFTIGLRLFGFALPSALLGAFLGTLLLYLFDGLLHWSHGRGRAGPIHTAFVLCGLLTLAALFAFGTFRQSTERALDRLIRSALPRPPPAKT